MLTIGSKSVKKCFSVDHDHVHYWRRGEEKRRTLNSYTTKQEQYTTAALATPVIGSNTAVVQAVLQWSSCKELTLSIRYTKNFQWSSCTELTELRKHQQVNKLLKNYCNQNSTAKLQIQNLQNFVNWIFCQGNKIHLRATASRSTCFWGVFAQPVCLPCKNVC